MIVTDIFMKAAFEEAIEGLHEGGVPIGSILVKDGKIIGRGHNRRVQDNDPIMHAEINCLHNGGRISTCKSSPLLSNKNCVYAQLNQF